MRVVEFAAILDDEAHNRMRVRLSVESGEVKDVMYQYETFLDGK